MLNYWLFISVYTWKNREGIIEMPEFLFKLNLVLTFKKTQNNSWVFVLKFKLLIAISSSFGSGCKQLPCTKFIESPLYDHSKCPLSSAAAPPPPPMPGWLSVWYPPGAFLLHHLIVGGWSVPQVWLISLNYPTYLITRYSACWISLADIFPVQSMKVIAILRVQACINCQLISQDFRYWVTNLFWFVWIINFAQSCML